MSVAAVAFLPREDDDSVRHVKPQGTIPSGNVVAIDDVLVGTDAFAGRAGGAVRSLDGGRTWGRALLPEQPGNLQRLEVRRLGDVAVATAIIHPAKEHDGTAVGLTSADVFVWTTADGHTWNQPLTVKAATGAHLTQVHLVGESLVTGARTKAGFFVFSDEERGRSWQQTPVPGLGLVEGVDPYLAHAWVAEDGSLRGLLHSFGPDNLAGLIGSHDGGASWRLLDRCTPPPVGPCHPIVRSGSLLVRGREGSLNGGATWKPMAFDPSMQHPTGFAAVEELPGGGWLASVQGSKGAGHDSLAWIARSDDGLSWVPVRAPSMTASAPVRAGDRWFVALWDPSGLALHAASLDGRDLHRVQQEKRGAGYLAVPFPWQDGVAMPVPRTDGMLETLLVVRD